MKFKERLYDNRDGRQDQQSIKRFGEYLRVLSGLGFKDVPAGESVEPEKKPIDWEQDFPELAEAHFVEGDK